jgi:EAL domain-containing protein (putative c-di-GMP-specific phosphodiesterase class I)
MRRSVNNDFKGFEAYFQPIVDIKNDRLSAAETLLRFQSEETGAVSPAEFIPLLEESGLIIPVGRWVLHQAMAACSRIQKYIPDFRISVNVSYIQVLKSDMLSEIKEAVATYGLPKGSMTMELTESGFLESDATFIKFCDGLKENDIPLALDDFGTGYSNFHYLYNLSPHTIKIDRSFTVKALNNSYEYNLLQHMVEMTHSIDLKLCIEGIETKQELDKISEICPDYIQGYYFGKPAPLEAFIRDHIEAGELA